MTAKGFNRWLIKRHLLFQLRNKARSNSIRVYFLRKTKEVAFIKTHKHYDEAIIVKVSSLDYATLQRYVPNGSFIIYRGRPTTGIVSFLVKSKGRKWGRMERKILNNT